MKCTFGVLTQREDKNNQIAIGLLMCECQHTLRDLILLSSQKMELYVRNLKNLSTFAASRLHNENAN